MVKKSYRLKGNQFVHIIPISDLHVGSQEFNEEYFNLMLDQIDAIKGYKRIYLCGDLTESANKQVGNASFRTNMTLNDQLDYVIDAFKPYKKDIISSCIGNHEARLSKDFDLDVMKIIAQALETKSGTQFIDTFKINGEDVKIYTSHGKGSSMHEHTAEGKMIRETQHIVADIYMQGHNHRCKHFSRPIFMPTESGKNIVQRRHYVFTGSFLRYTGYAEAMMLPILPEAFIRLQLTKERRVINKQFNIDEIAPELMEL